MPALADELVRRQVGVIVSTGSVRSTAAALAAAKTIPIVFIGGVDPVKLGWVQSLNHPGANVTGVSFISNALEAKRLGLLHDTVPRASVVGVLLNPENPTSEQQTKDLNDAAHTVGLTLHFAHVARESDVEPGFNSVLQRGAQAIAVATDANFVSWREQLVALTARAHVPAIFHDREFAVHGGLLSYGASITDAWRAAAGDAHCRVRERSIAICLCLPRRVPGRSKPERLRGRPKCRHRVPLGRRPRKQDAGTDR